jgi:hypothetical protein
MHPELLFTWIPRKYEAKDISDLYKYKGKQVTLNLIVKYLKWLKELR